MLQSDIKLDTLGYFVLADNEGIKKDMPACCETTGHEIVGIEEAESHSTRVYKPFLKISGGK